MAQERRIAAIKLLQRIKQHEIDGHAAKLATIRARQAELLLEIEDLIQMRDREGHASTIEAAPYLARFLRSIKSRNSYLTDQLTELEHQSADIEVQLETAFIESKANESVLNSTEKEVKQERERAETAASEEITRSMYLRRQRKTRLTP